MAIWDFNIGEFACIPEKHRVTLDEGNTPLVKLQLNGDALDKGIDSANKIDFWLKDENQNPSGSFKDRSLAYQLAYYLSKGYNRFVLSSSGNSAIALASFALKYDFKADIFLSEKINNSKLDVLKGLDRPNIKIYLDIKPKSAAFKFAKRKNLVNLRPSQDGHALSGYKTISYEILRDLPDVETVIVPCSSGTSALGIYMGFLELGKRVRLVVCQTARIHPLAKVFDKDFIKSDSSLADAVVDRVMIRKLQLKEVIKESSGAALVIDDELLKKAKGIFPKYSYNSLLGIAALIKLKSQNGAFSNICVIAGGR